MKNFSTHKFNFSLNFICTVLFILLLYPVINGQNIPWEKYSNNPVLDVGAPGSWDDMHVACPSVIFENDTFKMWYIGDDGNNIRIGYATSLDGVSWIKDYIHSPVLDVGNPGEWDDETVTFPSVVFVNGIYHMWYAGFPNSSVCDIGHATSPDGLVWTKDPDNPVLEQGPAGSWDSYWVDTPFIIFENDTFHLWYSGGSGSDAQIGYATTTNPNGKSWTKQSNPVLSPTSGNWDWPRVECPSIATYNDIFYMFYSGGTFEQHDIGFATSTDKVTWYKDPNPCLIRGFAGTWDDYDIMASYVIYDGNEYKMWYCGTTSSIMFRIGLASVFPLSVELTSFTATSQLGKVILNWSTATEINNLGFEIERASSSTTPGQEKLWRTIGFVPGKGTTTEPQEYSYIDDISEVNATSLVYRLKQMDFLGTYEYSDEVLVENPAPVDYVLYQNYPNPFNPTTTITFGIPVKTHVVLKVFNAVGEEVAQLYNGEKEAGRYTIEFNAEGLPSGIYFYQLKTENYIQMKKMILLR
jgi:predicted GH43/DUF377 family glycosyl hydrolase